MCAARAVKEMMNFINENFRYTGERVGVAAERGVQTFRGANEDVTIALGGTGVAVTGGDIEAKAQFLEGRRHAAVEIGGKSSGRRDNERQEAEVSMTFS